MGISTSLPDYSTMPDLIHLIYSSGATRDLSAKDLDALLLVSQRNNAAASISGMLLYSAGSFFQILEGPSVAVDAAFARIEQDSRHSNTTCIIREPIAERAFDSWTMGYAKLTDDEANEIVGRNDFYATRNCLMSLNPGRARKLLEAFAAGRWRTQVRQSATSATAPVSA